MIKIRFMGFKELFGVKPPVTYIDTIALKKCYLPTFKKQYEKCYKKCKTSLSLTRTKKFEAYFRKLERAGNDHSYTKRIQLRYINPKVRYGVFAKEAIAPYSTLTHYVGEMIPTKLLKVDHDCSFSFEHFPHFSIDAMKMGNWARFMNHADAGKPSNNVVVWEYYTEKSPYIVFTAGRKGIKKGQQLLYNYGHEYWQERTSIDLK